MNMIIGITSTVCYNYGRVTGALLGVLALFSGFFAEMLAMSTIAPLYALWRVSM